MPPSIQHSPPDPVLASTLRRLRLEKRLTQEELAHAVGLTTGSYARIERARSNPTWTTVVRLAEGLGMPVSEMAREIELDRAADGPPAERP